MNSEIKEKTVKGGFYLAGSNIFSQLISVIVNIALARYLMPEDYGVYALASSSIGFITLFLSIGFGSAIINQREIDKFTLSSLYWLSFVVSISCFASVFFVSELFQNFYQSSGLAKVMIYSSYSILLTPFYNTHFKILERNLELGKTSLIVILATILSSFVAVFSARIGLGIYALVLQTISISLFKLILTLLMSNWKPLVYFSWRPIKHMVWYALKYRMAQTVIFFERNIDYLILGKYLEKSVLGYYSFAYNIMYLPVKRIADLFRDTLFPAFSKLDDNRDLLIIAYFRSVRLVMMVSFPIMLLISFHSEFIIEILFGQKWMRSAKIISVLAIAGAFQSIGQYGDVMLNSVGLPEKSLFLALLRAGVTIVVLLVTVEYGIIAVAYCLVFSKIFFVAILWLFLSQEFELRWGNIIEELGGTILAICAFTLFESTIGCVLVDWLGSFAYFLVSLMMIISLIYVVNRLIIHELLGIIINKGNSQ